MKYGEAIAYNSPNVSYDGILIIYADSLINPIVLNNITIFYASNEDYSNLTTIGVLSIDINPQGIVSVEVLDKDVSAISSAQVISVGVSGQISIIG
jgi:UTP-glucose-1-phosphate uridylyltransferase